MHYQIWPSDRQVSHLQTGFRYSCIYSGTEQTYFECDALAGDPFPPVELQGPGSEARVELELRQGNVDRTSTPLFFFAVLGNLLDLGVVFGTS